MKQDKKELLKEQVACLDKVISTLRNNFENDFEDDINYLEIVKSNLSDFDILDK